MHVPIYKLAANELVENDEQWAAYESTGHFVVLAGPGSGKTKVLTTKLARILSEDVEAPRGVACVTYSNECARELKRRIDRLGIRPTRRTFVGTVHSFCFQNVVVPYAKLGGLDLADPIRVATDVEQGKCLADALCSAVSSNENPSHWSIPRQPTPQTRALCFCQQNQRDRSWYLTPASSVTAGSIDHYATPTGGSHLRLAAKRG